VADTGKDLREKRFSPVNSTAVKRGRRETESNWLEEEEKWGTAIPNFRHEVITSDGIKHLETTGRETARRRTRRVGGDEREKEAQGEAGKDRCNRGPPPRRRYTSKKSVERSKMARPHALSMTN